MGKAFAQSGKAKAPKRGGGGGKGNEKKQKKLQHQQKEEEARREAQAERDAEPVREGDAAYMEENEDYASFLLNLDEAVMVPMGGKKSKKAQAKAAVPTTARESSEEEGEETEKAQQGGEDPKPPLLDVEVARDLKGHTAKGWGGMGTSRKELEEAAASAEGGVSRLPVKTRDGKLTVNKRMRKADEELRDKRQRQGEKGGDLDGEEGGAQEKEPRKKKQKKDGKRGGAEGTPGDKAGGDGGGSRSSGDDEEEEEDLFFDSADDVDGAQALPQQELQQEQQEKLVIQERQRRQQILAAALEADPVRARAMQIQRREDKKAVIAELCEAILEDPEGAMHGQLARKQIDESEGDSSKSKKKKARKKEPSKIDQLHELIDDDDAVVQKLAMLSEFALFKDIVPAYRIRVWTAKEQEQRVGKEVARVRDQEALLLRAYQRFLKALEGFLVAAETVVSPGGRSSSREVKGKHSVAASHGKLLGLSAARCLGGLLLAHSHFNFRSNIISILVRGLSHPVEEVRVENSACLERLFKEEKKGDVSLEVVKAIAKHCKACHYKVAPDTIRCMTALPLRVHEDEADRVRKAAKRKNKQRKRNEIDGGLMEAEAVVDKDSRAQQEANTLHDVVLIYFRVLKQHPTPTLLPPVLEGLAKFSHLINLDTVEDLLDVLKGMLERGVGGGGGGEGGEGKTKLSVEASLHCVLMAFKTLHGAGRELGIDEKEFVVQLYNMLQRVTLEQHRGLIPLCVSCCEWAFLRRREYSAVRVSATLKRLAGVALHQRGEEQLLLVRLCCKLAMNYPSCRQLLENEQDRMTAGSFDPSVPDPELSNPNATSLWELSLLKFSANEAVRAAVEDLSRLGGDDKVDAFTAMYKGQVRERDLYGVVEPFLLGCRAPQKPPKKDGGSSQRGGGGIRFVSKMLTVAEVGVTSAGLGKA